MKQFNKLYTNLNIPTGLNEIYLKYKFNNKFKNFVQNYKNCTIYYIPDEPIIIKYINNDFIKEHNIQLVYSFENNTYTFMKNMFNNYKTLYFTIDYNLKIFNDFNIFVNNIDCDLYFNYYLK